jgi:TolB-like protein|tara:strand:+ start:2161 stop:3651 length:1491 start_codon:yes stop_codon:yes gene_type:complete
MSKAKMASSFLKIKFHNIGSVLIKTAGTYAVSGFALIQLSSIVVDNISTEEVLGITSESFMQLLFIVIISGFPLSLILAFIFKRKSISNETLKDYESLKKIITNKKPKVGLIPFENLNDDSDGAFLVDGIVEDLITELSMVKEISVATRKTCFGFRNKDYTTEAFKEEWGFDYVVSGSIRSSNDKLRISVELSDMDNDEVIWSNKYDKFKTDIFSLQDEIVTQIIFSIIGEIEITSLKRAHRKPTESMTSYEYTLQGRALNQKFEKEANAEAIKMLDAAIEADELNPLPHSWKACTLGQSMFLGFKERDEVMPAMLESLSKANELNDNDWNTNRILAEANLTMNNFEQTKLYATKAYRANPNNPHVLSIYGESLLRNGDIETAIKIFEKMHELEPIVAADLNSDRPIQAKLFAYYSDGNLAKCKELLSLLEDFSSKTWISLLDLYVKNNESYKEELWYSKGLNKFKDINWDDEIKTYHLSDKNMIESLTKTTTLFA